MSFMRLLNTSTTTYRVIVTCWIEANNIDEFSRVQSALLALNILEFDGI